MGDVIAYMESFKEEACHIKTKRNQAPIPNRLYGQMIGIPLLMIGPVLKSYWRLIATRLLWQYQIAEDENVSYDSIRGHTVRLIG